MTVVARPKFICNLFEYEFQKKRKSKSSAIDSKRKIIKGIAINRNSSLLLGEFPNRDDKNWVW
jgi:hypothetical protein